MKNFVRNSRLVVAGLVAASCLSSFPVSAETVDQPAPAAQINGLAAVVIGVSDIESAYEFYTSVLGLKPVREVKTEKYIERIMSAPDGEGTRIVLFESLSEDVPMHSRIVFYTDDAEGIIGGMSARELEVVHPPAAFPGTSVIVGIAKDADGNLLEFIQLPEATPPSE